MNRFIVSESPYDFNRPHYGRYTFQIEDTKTNQKQIIDFKWVGKNMKKTGTWDYAPLTEMQELGIDSFNEFRLKLHQDDDFAEQQIIMNRRHNIWWEKHKTEKLKYEKSTNYHTHNRSVRIRQAKEIHTRFNNYLMKCKDIDGTSFLFSANLSDKDRTYQDWVVDLGVYKVLQYFNERMDYYNSLKFRLNLKLKLNLSCEEIQMIKAHKKSENLIREWLSEDELRWLVYQDELKITYEDEIFIVRKDPNALVESIKNGKTEKYCVIAKDSGVATGDVLLTKIMLLKTNPALFKKIARQR